MEITLARRRDAVGLPRRLLLAAASAVLMALSLPNELFSFGFPPLGFLALVPLYTALAGAGSPGGAALAAGVFGALQHAFSSYWLWFFKDFAFWTLGSTTIAYGIIYAVLGLYLGLSLDRGGPARPLLFALLWTAFEYLKSAGFLGYPWGLLPYSLSRCLSLLQIADVTGVYGISFVLALANASVAELCLSAASGGPPILGPGRRRSATRLRVGLVSACLASALVLGLALYGRTRLSRPFPEIGRLKAILVQQNVDSWTSGEELGLATSVRLARKALAAGAGRPDIIIFSESTLLRPYKDFRRFFTQRPLGDPLTPFIVESGAYLLTGAPVILDYGGPNVDDPILATNSVILIDPSGKQVQDYAKVHPVPFAEAIPFWDLPAFRSFIQNVVGLESGWEMGKEYKVFDLDTRSGAVRFGAPICFEDAFSDVCRQFYDRGADLFINLTNDSWSTQASAEIQHWAVARFRSIEFRRTLLRSTNGGLSCVVGPDGRVLEALPLFEEASRLVEVPICREDRPTAFALYGDWFARAVLLLSALSSLILMVRGPQRKGGKGREHSRVS